MKWTFVELYTFIVGQQLHKRKSEPIGETTPRTFSVNDETVGKPGITAKIFEFIRQLF